MSDLIDTDTNAIVTTFETVPTERAPRRNNDGYEIGVCRVCGNEAATPSGTYCDEHKTRQRKTTSSQQQVPGEGGSPPSGTDSVRRPQSTGRGAPKADEWSNKVFDKLVILMSALFASSMVRRNGLNDPNDAITDALTMESDEARRIARPIGRYMAGTKFSKTRGRQVLENSDLLDAGFAMYDYMDRVNRTLRQVTTSPLASVTPIRTPTPQEPEPEGGTERGPIESQTVEFGGGNFPNINGWNYVP